MYSLFSDRKRDYGGKISDYHLHNVLKRTVEDVERVIDYYRYGTFAVPNTHLLVKLINTISTPLSYDLDRYDDVTRARAFYAANSLQLTSSINIGRWFHGVFYKECPELILAYVGNDRASELVKDWRNLQAVKFLETPISNMRYLVPNGENRQTEQGLVVVSVDLAMLMIQYRCFMEEQYARMADKGSMLGVTHFVAKYVLPNMLKSQTDLAIFNRLYNLQMGAPMGHGIDKHPFYITDYTDQLDKGLLIYLERLTNSKREYANYVDQLPSAFNDHPLDMPDVLETRQVWWLLFLSRIKASEFLIDVGGREGVDFNRELIGKLKIQIKAFDSDKLIERMTFGKVKDDLLDFFRLCRSL